MTYLPNVNISLSDGPSIDAFSRLRVSEPLTLLDSSFSDDAQPLIWESLVANGGAVAAPANAYIAMSVPAAANAAAVRQTKRYIPYQPGKSKLVFLTGVMMEDTTAVDGITGRIGMFDDLLVGGAIAGAGYLQTGLFFQYTGGAGNPWAVVERLGGVDTATTRNNWNIDQLDGNGPSGYNFTDAEMAERAQIYVMDLEWLGVGRVRYGFVIDGLIVYIHEAFHSATVVAQQPYTLTASLPARYELFNTTGVNTAVMRQICCTVISEGGFNPNGPIYSANRPVAQVTAGTNVRIISVRLQAGFMRTSFEPRAFSLLGLSAGNVQYEIVLNPTFGGAAAVWTPGPTGSHVEYDVAAGTATGGILVDSGYLSRETRSITQLINGTLFGAYSVNGGTPDVFTIRATSTGGSVDMLGSITWQEFI